MELARETTRSPSSQRFRRRRSSQSRRSVVGAVVSRIRSLLHRGERHQSNGSDTGGAKVRRAGTVAERTHREPHTPILPSRRLHLWSRDRTDVNNDLDVITTKRRGRGRAVSLDSPLPMICPDSHRKYFVVEDEHAWFRLGGRLADTNIKAMTTMDVAGPVPAQPVCSKVFASGVHLPVVRESSVDSDATATPVLRPRSITSSLASRSPSPPAGVSFLRLNSDPQEHVFAQKEAEPTLDETEAEDNDDDTDENSFAPLPKAVFTASTALAAGSSAVSAVSAPKRLPLPRPEQQVLPVRNVIFPLDDDEPSVGIHVALALAFAQRVLLAICHGDEVIAGRALLCTHTLWRREHSVRARASRRQQGGPYSPGRDVDACGG
ncbi:hypothetical protein THASP1DRAFT_21497 [Thamnocephalis sphaerospora]|uniref:Uncharacterized protein n=1 Tax=Thamnocephalis sphaerospora TaxID=78915 RepID=A0A4P9XWQ4_9FUNG|nr:hypothetical protein THASP1DRAFT_21497 [Thamnocephalis sphaerospora]|eukprot:RKP10833.1 hypothetical protein THASP1DRAFT_21497 [Thamnocephalis sphaerospora]